MKCSDFLSNNGRDLSWESLEYLLKEDVDKFVEQFGEIGAKKKF